MDISLADIIDIMVDSSLLVTLFSFFIYLAKKKRKRLTEERKDILHEVQDLILGIKKFPIVKRQNF